MWRNHHNPLDHVGAAASYDDVWQGGFEELFPNDAPTSFGDGPVYPVTGSFGTSNGRLMTTPRNP